MATRKTKKSPTAYKELLLTQEEINQTEIMDAVYHNFPICGNRHQHENTDPPCYGEYDRGLSLDKMFR